MILNSQTTTINYGQLKDIFDKTIVEYSNSRVKIIAPKIFQNCSSLMSVNFPACTVIGTSAFADCYNLTTVNFSNCEKIGTSAFSNCSSLEEVVFPNCTLIEYYAFSNCQNLRSISFPNCVSIMAGAFWKCSFSAVTLENCRSLGRDAFAYCPNLEVASFPNCWYIDYSVFAKSPKFKSLYLTGSSVAKLAHFGAFESTLINTASGRIYVPSSLLATYRVASQWKAFSSRFVGV